MRRSLLWLARGACLISLLASLWALLRPGDCAACEATTLLTGGPLVPSLGVAWYSLLLAWLLWRGFTPAAGIAAATGVGVHLGLAGLMASTHHFCLPCGVAALGAILIAAAAWLWPAADRRLLAAVGAVIGLAAVCAMQWAAQQPHYRLNAALQQALGEARQHGPVAAGRVELTYFRRDGCHLCERFDREELPVLRREFGDRLTVVTAAAWPALPTPTLVIRGRHETVLYLLPQLATMERLLQDELGGD
jgi:hypothetical protein